MWTFLLILLVVVVIVFLLGLFLWGLHKAIMLALNSVVGFFALYAVQAWLVDSLVINVWSVLLTAILGIFGFAAVLILHFLHLFF